MMSIERTPEDVARFEADMARIEKERRSLQSSKWIRFEFNGSTGKTKRWLVFTKDNNPAKLGTVKWYAQWRQYAFFPEPNTLYERQCLRDLADFCERQTKSHSAIRNPQSAIK